MHLGYIADSPLARNGQRYFYQGGEWVYAERLSSFCDTLDICAPILNQAMADLDTASQYTTPLAIPNARVYEMLPVANDVGTTGWLRRRISTLHTLRRLSSSWDFVFMMAPSWSAVLGWSLSHIQKWDYAVYFRSDWVERAPHRLPARLRNRLFLVPYLYLIQKLESAILHDATLRLTEGRLLFDRYPHLQSSLYPSVTLQLTTNQFRLRDDSCDGTIVKLVTVGALTAGKGMDITMRAVKRLSFDFPVELHIVGVGEERAELERLAVALQLVEQVHFHGYISNTQSLLDLMYECDIFVLTSYSEGFPRVIYEAFSQSLPVVATDVGGIPLTLTNEQHALLVPSGDPAAAAAALQRIICRADVRRRLIQKGYEFAYESISSEPIEAVMHTFRAIFNSIPK